MTIPANPLYRAAQVAAFDQIAIHEVGIAGATLMKRAGACAFSILMSHWPQTKKILVLCGNGNNGGDGYVIARLARQRNIKVDVIQLGDVSRQSDVARQAREAMEHEGVTAVAFTQQDFNDYDVIIDALLGIGLQREVSGEFKSAINAINASKTNTCKTPVVALDVPSGLDSNTGKILGAAVVANLTVCFIARKQGLYTNDGKTCCGEIHYDALDVPDGVFAADNPSAYLIEALPASRLFDKRRANTHKGDYGHVLVIGGAPGMSGAVRLAAIAAMRSGCGLVSVATHPEHAMLINSYHPEIMSHAVRQVDELDILMTKADVIIIGPGFGQSTWAETLFAHCITTDKPLVIDADGLRLLVKKHLRADNWVLTPHPGEAAALLNTTISAVQADRFAACRALNDRYGGIAVLKGAGTLTADANEIYVNGNGNPGMACAGMGDVLSGVIASFLAQTKKRNVDDLERVCLAVYTHAWAGDLAATDLGENGLMATDLIPYLTKIINQRV